MERSDHSHSLAAPPGLTRHRDGPQHVLNDTEQDKLSSHGPRLLLLPAGRCRGAEPPFPAPLPPSRAAPTAPGVAPAGPGRALAAAGARLFPCLRCRRFESWCLNVSALKLSLHGFRFFFPTPLWIEEMSALQRETATFSTPARFPSHSCNAFSVHFTPNYADQTSIDAS